MGRLWLDAWPHQDVPPTLAADEPSESGDCPGRAPGVVDEAT